MSYQIKLQDLSIDERKKIMNDLVFEQVVGTNNSSNQSKKIYSYSLEPSTQVITLPFHYYINTLVKTIQKNLHNIDNNYPSFTGKLFDEQIVSRNECINHLNKEKSCILSLPVGCGKCLHPDTEILMFDGSIKTAKEININDVLFGDDNKPRIVKSTVTGRDKLYTIRNDEYDVNYTVNSSHILTLYNIQTRQIEDVPLSHVMLNLSIYRGVRTSIFNLGGKGIRQRYAFITLHFKGLETFTTLDENLKNNLIYIGRSLGLIMKSKIVGNKWVIKQEKGVNMGVNMYPFIIEYHSTGIYNGFELSGNGRFLLGDFTITHNTATSINIAAKIKLKTLVILNRLLLMEQWESSILKFCPNAKVYVIQPKTKVIPENYDFYLINAINVSKLERDVYKFIGFCIVDECHMIMSEILSKCMWSVEPKYLLGLSATPYRMDGLNDMISAYFGPHRVIQNIKRKHIVYKVNTKLTIDFTYNRFGKMDWNSLLTSQSQNEERNQIIVDIIKKFPERYFLLLTKRIEQGKLLSKMLNDENIDHDCLFGTNKYIESTKHVLIGTTGKCGVGFDAPKLNTLVLCNDMVNYYIQMLGRVMRRKDCDAWVFDLVDENSILKKHYYERCKIYKEYGGTFEKF